MALERNHFTVATLRARLNRLHRRFEGNESLLPAVHQHNLPTMIDVARTYLELARQQTPLNRKESLMSAHTALNEVELVLNTFAHNKPKQDLALDVFFDGFQRALPHFLHALDRRHPLEFRAEGLAHHSIRLDPHLVRGALAILVHNAILATRQGKHPGAPVIVNARVATHDGLPHVWFEIHDQGPGVPSHLFDSLFSKAVPPNPKESRRGFGAEGVRRMVNDHLGMVLKESVKGQGSRLGFLLPLLH